MTRLMNPQPTQVLDIFVLAHLLAVHVEILHLCLFELFTTNLLSCVVITNVVADEVYGR